jgi:predicted transcriptional regulator
MEKRKAETFALTLRLPSDLKERLDSTARKLFMNRTNFIIKSLNRNLQFCTDVELPQIESTHIREILQP